MKQIEEQYELTNPQKSIWFMQQFYNNSISNLTGTNRMYINIDIALLKQAINILIQSHDVLMTRLVMQENKPMQYYAKYQEVTIDTIELKDEIELEDFIKQLTIQKHNGINEIPYRFYIFTFPDKTGGFIFSVNHMFSDAWSTTLIANQVVAIYENLLNNATNEVYKSSYKKYITEEKEYQISQRYLKDKEYWENKFDTLPQRATLSQRNIARSMDTSSIRKEIQINEGLSKKIYEYCEKKNISPYIFFLAIYSIYISRVNNLDKIIIGTPILNRKNMEFKRTLGMFVNTLPIDIELNSNMDINELFKEISNKSLSLFKHQRYSYFDIAQYINKRHDNNEGIYDIIFSYQNAKSDIDELKINYSLKWNFNGNIPESINIHVSDLDKTDMFNIYYDYQVCKFDNEDILDIHERILNIINQIIQSDKLIKDIEIITVKEENIIVNNNQILNTEFPKGKTVVDLFLEQVLLYPNNIAVTIEEENITYKELNEKSNQLARFLINRKINIEDVIAIRMNKSIEMIIGILAIIKVGACYLPIDLSYPKDRIDFMLKDSNAKLLLTNEQVYNNVDVNLEKINVSLNNEKIYLLDNKKVDIIIKPDNLIYIIYTSGSTGIPKGVMLTHENVVRLVKNDKFQFDFSNKDVWTMFHSVAFDFSVWEMYGALLYGGRLVLIKEDVAKDAVEFLKILRKEKVTVLNQTPTYFYNLLDNEEKFNDNDLALRYIIFGGEALKPSIIRPWKEKYKQVKLINMYGITETTVHVTFKELNEMDLANESSNIGQPIPTMKIYIMDKYLKLLPYGVVGQICVAGSGLGRGYLNRPELNENKFIYNPYVENQRLYLSGDSGYLDKSGDFYYKERIDTQVKVRGYRVELGEIETKLLSYSHISKCIVLAQKKTDRDSQLIAYIICECDFEISELRDYLQDILPVYMIPSFFIKIQEFPLNSNGKVDRKKLQELSNNLHEDVKYVAPDNKFEEVFSNIVKQALGYNKVSVESDIIELGADSLTLMKITAQLLENGYIVNIQDIYEKRTIRNICKNIHNEVVANEIKENANYEFKEEFNKERIKYDNILLTGVTGFIGMHILYELMKNTSSTVYCLVRDKNGVDAGQRLKEKLQYYFKDDLTYLIGSRIIIVKGDVELQNMGIKESEYNPLSRIINVVIHAAAIVSHYGDKAIFESINIQGTKNIVRFCMDNNILLNYISTISVLDTNNKEDVIFDEHMLYTKQKYNKNVYIRTKFEAELYIYNQMKNGLQAIIYRLGNITARISDGQFQENSDQNAFLNRVLSFAKIKKIPYSISNLEIDLTPVDQCSNSIINIMQYMTSYNKVFHIVNNNKITVKQLMKLLGIRIKEVSNEELNKSILKNKQEIIGIINDITTNELENYRNKIYNDITIRYMNKLNIEFSQIDKAYIKNFIKKYL